MSAESQDDPQNSRKGYTVSDLENSLVDQAAHAQELAFSASQRWVRHIVTLAGAALTLLVSLQKSYLTPNPESVRLLKLCWGCLIVAVLVGIIALYEEVLKLKADAKRLNDQLLGNAAKVGCLEKIIRKFCRAFPRTYVWVARIVRPIEKGRFEVYQFVLVLSVCGAVWYGALFVSENLPK